MTEIKSYNFEELCNEKADVNDPTIRSIFVLADLFVETIKNHPSMKTLR